MLSADEDELHRRAVAAYYRIAARDGYGAVQHSERNSGYERYNGLDYVVLRNNGQTLAVYRVRNDGVLRRLKRWPAELNRN